MSARTMCGNLADLGFWKTLRAPPTRSLPSYRAQDSGKCVVSVQMDASCVPGLFEGWALGRVNGFLPSLLLHPVRMRCMMLALGAYLT
jgi:hypothetical protein